MISGLSKLESAISMGYKSLNFGALTHIEK
jgi:hypothetical protein